MILGLTILFGSPSHLIAQDVTPVKEEVGESTIKDYIKTYSTQFGSNADDIYSVMMCESEGLWLKGDYKDGSYHTFGQWQYFKETWDRYSKLYRETYGAEDQFDIKSAHDQAKLTSFVFSLSESSKREWTTYRALKNGGIYKFYSKFHKKWFTVECYPQKLI